MSYSPIENYGVIGNMHTAALVSMNGSIDWFCLPRFDSPSVFGALLDEKKGGRFLIAPTIEQVTYKQFYWPDSNVLMTRFLSADGAAEIVDFMPVEEVSPKHGEHQLIRRVRVLRGSMAFQLECLPAFNYARDRHEVQVLPQGACFHSPALSLGLASLVRLKEDGRGGVLAEFTLGEGESTTFLLQVVSEGKGCGPALKTDEADALFQSTIRFWRDWISRCTYRGRWREMVCRSALLLKLLIYEPTGAIISAPTCSLPEHVGGQRNWDYRFTWVRDAAFTIYALMRIGFTEEAANFIQWLDARCHERKSDGSLQTMYGIDGRHDLREETLEHLEGYKRSRPVRVGNAAHQQLQLDIYGELMDSVYLYNKYGNAISYDLWSELRELINWVVENWRRPDHGIWETRGDPQHFVYSKLMCWVALDRGLRLMDKRSFPADRESWLKNRDTIYGEILSKGWSSKRKAFVQHYGSDALDASNLVMPLAFFTSPTDPRMLKTLDAITLPPDQQGLVSNSLVFRYDPKQTADGLPGDEGTFNMCTFWLVEALTRAGRFDRSRLDQARLIFEGILGYANHLGLYSEEIGPRGEALGNFPQAFTHVALISAAYNLNLALGP
jgi:GH15 family glucan-1,4-alpha-glucosidase